MTAEALISKLEKVRQSGRGSWIARCPAHEDKSPSMTIREVEDGRVLVHCFSGCAVENILSSVGLDFDALFPPRPLADRMAPLRRPFPAADVLEAVAHEALVVQLTAKTLAEKRELAPPQVERMRVAVARIHEARELVRG
jgi:hypothetical protein